MGKKKYKDIEIGDKFGHLTVKGFDCMKGNHMPYWLCECDCEGHNIVSIYDYELKSGHRISCGCVTHLTLEERRLTHSRQTFYDFCIEYGRQDVLDLWDYNLNTLTPDKVAYGTSLKYYFKCPRGLHESSLKSIDSVVYTIKNNVEFEPCKKCRSFAQFLINKYGENALNIYWDYELNTVDPWDIAYGSRARVYIKCTEKDYHGSYPIFAYDFANGTRCPFCSCRKLHRLDSLGCQYPQVLDLWSDKNTKTPFEYSTKCASYAWFKCSTGEHEDSYRLIHCATTNGFGCPICAKSNHVSKLQKKVDAYLHEIGEFDIRHEHNCTIVPYNVETKKPMPFDNEVVDLKLIIEVHGLQHYQLTSWSKYRAQKYGITPEEDLKNMQDRDAYKMNYALEQGYYYLSIPYWTEKDENYKKLIDDKIKEIIQNPIIV